SLPPRARMRNPDGAKLSPPTVGERTPRPGAHRRAGRSHSMSLQSRDIAEAPSLPGTDRVSPALYPAGRAQKTDPFAPVHSWCPPPPVFLEALQTADKTALRQPRRPD